MKSRERFNIYITSRIKRRLKNISEDKDISMNDIINNAINDYLDHVDAENSAPDFVLERIDEVLTSQVKLVNNQDKLNDKITELNQRLDDRK